MSSIRRHPHPHEQGCDHEQGDVGIACGGEQAQGRGGLIFDEPRMGRGLGEFFATQERRCRQQQLSHLEMLSVAAVACAAFTPSVPPYAAPTGARQASLPLRERAAPASMAACGGGATAGVWYPHALATTARRAAQPLRASDAAANDPEHDAKVAKALKAMVGFSNSYVKNTDTRYCSDPSIAAVVMKGLAEHKATLGVPLCPCRHYEDKAAEAKDGYWNCPCVPMRERHECHCMLFLTKDNEFAGDNQHISVEEADKLTSGMSIL